MVAFDKEVKKRMELYGIMVLYWYLSNSKSKVVSQNE